MSIPNTLKPLTVLVTGANKGLSLAIVQALVSSKDQSYKVYLGSRSLDRANEAIESLEKAGTGANTVIPLQLDIDDDASIAAAHAKISNEAGSIDVLVNNAGVNYGTFAEHVGMTLREAFRKDFDTNVASTSALISTVADLLLKASQPRIIFISSSVASLAAHADKTLPINQSPVTAGWPKPWHFGLFTYRTSKTALNMAALEWARVLGPDGVKVHLVCPGFLATNLGGSTPDALRAMGAQEPAEAGSFVVRVLEGERDADIGKLINEGGVIPW